MWQLFGNNGAMKPSSEIKRAFGLSKNNHFYWIQLNNAIPKTWKESKCNSQELCSLQVFLNDSETKSHIYFEKKI